MLNKEDFTQVNFHVFCAEADGVKFIYQYPLAIEGSKGSHASRLGHPVLLIDGKINKVKDFDEAIELANKQLT